MGTATVLAANLDYNVLLHLEGYWMDKQGKDLNCL